jgi:hypothetical protein
MFTSKYFNMGKVVVTCGINEAMENERFTLEISLALKRYAVKDWGDLSLSDQEINNDALQNPDDLYLLAAYQTCKGKIYIITNRISENPGDNSTIVCFPEER